MNFKNLTGEDLRSFAIAKKKELFSPEEFDTMVATVNDFRPFLNEEHTTPSIAMTGKLILEKHPNVSNDWDELKKFLSLAERICVGEQAPLHAVVNILLEAGHIL